MARTKKITTEQLIGLIDNYAFDYPREKIKIPALSNYICKKGFDVAAYLIRRDGVAREYIDKLNAQDNNEMQRNVVTYHQLDLEKFISTNGTREKMKTALAQRDTYYASIASCAAKAFAENKDLKASIEYYRKANEELKTKLEEKAQKTENKAIRKREAVIRGLKKLLDDYVYPEVANQLLVKEGLLQTVSEIIDKESLAAITVKPSTDISAVSFQTVEELMNGFDN